MGDSCALGLWSAASWVSTYFAPLYQVASIDNDMVVLHNTDESMVLQHFGEYRLDQMAGLCSGLGGVSLGATIAGFQVVAELKSPNGL